MLTISISSKKYTRTDMMLNFNASECEAMLTIFDGEFVNSFFQQQNRKSIKHTNHDHHSKSCQHITDTQTELTYGMGLLLARRSLRSLASLHPEKKSLVPRDRFDFL